MAIISKKLFKASAMIDLKLLQRDFDTVKKSLLLKKVDPTLLDELQQKAQELKLSKQTYEELQAEQNSLSKLFGQFKRDGKDTDELKEQIESLKSRVTDAQHNMRVADEALSSLASTVPNIPDESVKAGDSEDDNTLLKHVLEPTEFNFTPKEHWELAEQSGWIDFERGVKIAKSRFAILRHDAAKLERALINFMLDFVHSRGFDEVSVPYIVNEHALFGTGNLPKFEDDLFKIDGEKLYLIPTAEVPLTNLYQNEILRSDELPIKLAAHTSCFRKEAGSAGRDTRGIIRQHQFHKVELVSITTAQQSAEVFEQMLDCASDILTALKLPHRLMKLCGGDLGFSASYTVDIEVWLPGQGCYREISSISNTKEFQARRAKIRYKDNGKNHLAHTLNGSSLAIGRTIVAIMENYQDSSGNIAIPEVLKPYMK